MASTNNGLPEGTDAVIEGGGTGGSGGTTGRSGTVNQGGSPSSATNSTGGRTSTTAGDVGTDSLITGQTTDQGRSLGGGGGSGGSGSGGGDTTGSGGGSDGGNKSGIRGIISTAGTKAKDEATSRARGFVGQGLTSSSATLGNVAGIIEDTVEQIGERLGPQYADYARTASQTIQRYATTLENKDPDELVDDVRNVVRKSPSVALGAAAIIGFGLARLLRAGISESGSSGSTGASTGSTGTGGSSATGSTGGTSTSSTAGGGSSLAGKTQPKV